MKTKLKKNDFKPDTFLISFLFNFFCNSFELQNS